MTRVALDNAQYGVVSISGGNVATITHSGGKVNAIIRSDGNVGATTRSGGNVVVCVVAGAVPTTDPMFHHEHGMATSSSVQQRMAHLNKSSGNIHQLLSIQTEHITGPRRAAHSLVP